MRCSLAVLAFLSVGVPAAHATDVLGGGPLYAGPTQSVAVCYINNIGTASVAIVSHVISNVNGTPVTLTVNECAATLSPKAGCGIAATVSNSAPYSCRFGVSPSKTNVRGILEMRTSGEVTVRNVALQ